ncbi:ABC-three component system protein [Ignatzschineria sp. LJL83]
MNDKVIDELPHTAMSTWSGYVYQGKIALYHCIQKMIESYEDNINLKLQLESHDDFAIFDSSRCISIHQVKAYKCDYFSSYSADIIKQKDSANAKGIAKAYFHTAKSIKNIPDIDSFRKSYAPVEIYLYEGLDNNILAYCSLDKVNEYIEESLRKLISQTDNLGKWKNNLLERIRKILEAHINDHVIRVHQKIHISKTSNQKYIAANEFVLFETLYKIIESDDFEELENNDFFLSRLKLDIGNYYQDFCNENEYLNSKNMQKLDEYISQIVDFNEEEMLGFLSVVMPHKKGTFSTLEEFKDDSINSDSMRLGLLKILSSLIQAQPSECGTVLITWKDDGGNFYYPTGIHTANENADAICAKIMKHSLEKDVEFLFEGASLITLAIDKDPISSIRKCDFKEATSNKDNNRKITDFKNLKMISLFNVPSELKE